jgi:16S rRNA (guanine966-N2)-methyltransferase
MFSGTGSISLEFLSRGCKQLTSVDRERGCIDFLTKTATKLGFTNLTTFRTDVFVFLKKNTQKFDIAFADPPFKAAYKSDLIDKVLEVQLLSEEGVFILEHSTDEKFDDKPSFRFVRNYGNVAFSFFANFDLSSVSINDPS